jgi:hypothetical protein
VICTRCACSTSPSCGPSTQQKPSTVKTVAHCKTRILTLLNAPSSAMPNQPPTLDGVWLGGPWGRLATSCMQRNGQDIRLYLLLERGGEWQGPSCVLLHTFLLENMTSAHQCMP